MSVWTKNMVSRSNESTHNVVLLCIQQLCVLLNIGFQESGLPYPEVLLTLLDHPRSATLASLIQEQVAVKNDCQGVTALYNLQLLVSKLKSFQAPSSFVTPPR